MPGAPAIPGNYGARLLTGVLAITGSLNTASGESAGV